jgi:hypothetical protein
MWICCPAGTNRRCVSCQGNSRRGDRVAMWVPGPLRQACPRQHVQALCRRAVVVRSAPSTVEQMPRKVQPHGSGNDTEAAAVARSWRNHAPGYVNELAKYA